MRMWPCDSKFVRTFKKGNQGNLGNCYANISGLTQTCKINHECGARTKASDWNKDVCASGLAYITHVQSKCCTRICAGGDRHHPVHLLLPGTL